MATTSPVSLNTALYTCSGNTRLVTLFRQNPYTNSVLKRTRSHIRLQTFQLFSRHFFANEPNDEEGAHTKHMVPVQSCLARVNSGHIMPCLDCCGNGLHEWASTSAAGSFA